jgi:hypothetical protein
MRRRAVDCGGTLEIEGATPSGTIVRAVLPMPTVALPPSSPARADTVADEVGRGGTDRSRPMPITQPA